MKILNVDADSAELSLSIVELDAVKSALNEARFLLKGRDGWEFATRIGMSIEEAGALIKTLQALIGDIDERSGFRHSGSSQTRTKLTG